MKKYRLVKYKYRGHTFYKIQLRFLWSWETVIETISTDLAVSKSNFESYINDKGGNEIIEEFKR